MKLDAMRIMRVESGSDLIQLRFNPVSFPFKDRDSSENEKPLRGIPDRTRFICIKKMHCDSKANKKGCMNMQPLTVGREG